MNAAWPPRLDWTLTIVGLIRGLSCSRGSRCFYVLLISSVIGTGTILQAYRHFNDCSINEKPQVVDEFGVFQGRGKHLPFQAMLRTQTGDCLLACGGVWVAKRGLLVAWVGFIGVGLDTVWR